MNRVIRIAAGVACLVVLLAGAAFVGGQLFRTQQQAQTEQAGQSPPRKLVTPAADLPAEPPSARGDVQRRDNNSLFICDSNGTVSVAADGSVNNQPACSPVVEVVIGHDTQFLHDVTAQRNPVAAKQGQDVVIQQAIEPGSAGDIAENTAVRAWGTQSGERLIARIVLYWNREPRPAGTPAAR